MKHTASPSAHQRALRALSCLLIAAAFAATSCDSDSDSDNSPAGDAMSDTTSDGTNNTTPDGTTNTDPDAQADTPDTTPNTCQATVTAPDLSAFTAGTFPNAIEAHDGYLYVVNSGDNTIQRIDLASGASDPSFVNVGEDQNPYDLTIYGDRIYITNLLGNSVTVADLTTGQVINTVALPELISPQDITATEDHLLIANTEFVFGSGATTFGSLAVLSRTDSPTLVNKIPTTQPNPQFVFIHGDAAYTVNSGLIEYDANFVSTPVGDAGLDAFSLSSLSTATAPTQNISIGAAQGFIGNPGAPAILGDSAFLGSGTGPNLFQVNLSSRTLTRGTTNPIPVRPDDGTNALVIPLTGPDGKLYVADFNRDTLLTLDPLSLSPCGDPLNVGESPELLEGPLALSWDADNRTGYLLKSVSASITRLSLPQ